MASSHFMAFSDRITGMGQIESAAAWNNVTEMQDAAKAGKIGPLKGFETAKVYAMQGGDDQCAKDAPAAAAKFYKQLGSNVSFHLTPKAHHGFVTDQTNITGCDHSVCGSCGGNFHGMVQECNYDMAGALLQQLYRPEVLKPRVLDLAGRGQIVWFNQTKFFPAGISGDYSAVYACNQTCDDTTGRCPCSGMWTKASAYVPKECGVADIPPPDTGVKPSVPGDKACRVHVVYPGCGCGPDMGPSYGGITQYVGFNYWAESNNIIILYPGHQCPAGLGAPCWNCIKDPNANSRAGVQMNVVNRMVDWLAAGPSRWMQMLI